MRSFAALLSIALMLPIGTASRAAEADATQPEPLFIVHFARGPAWIEGKPFPEQAGAGEHSAHLKRLREAGKIVLGARYADQGMIVVRAASEEAARTEVAEDPMVAAGTFAMTIAAFHPFYPGCIP